MVTVANSKQVIYAGFQRAIADQMRRIALVFWLTRNLEQLSCVMR